MLSRFLTRKLSIAFFHKFYQCALILGGFGLVTKSLYRISALSLFVYSAVVIWLMPVSSYVAYIGIHILPPLMYMCAE